MTTTYATHLGTGAASDPTAVMGRRILAWILDGIIFLALTLGVLALVGEYQEVDADFDDNVEFCERLLDDNRDFDGNCVGPPFGDRVYLIETSDSLVQSGVSLGWFLLNFVLLQGLVGATVGKLLTGVRVVNVRGTRAGIGRCFLRSVAWIVDGITCGVPIVGGIAAVTSNGHRRVGDMIAGTRVVGTKSVGTPVDIAPVAAPVGAQPWGAAPPPSAPPAWDQPSAPPPGGQPRYGEPPTTPPPGPTGFAAAPATPPPWAPPGESGPTPDPTTVSPAFDPTMADVPAPPPDAPPSGARVDLPPPVAGPVPESVSPDAESEGGWIGDSTEEPVAEEPPQEPDPWMVGAERAEEETMPPPGDTGVAEPTWTDLDTDAVDATAADESIAPSDVHTMAETAESTGVGSLPLPDPQWDAARNTYIQWDPNASAWLQWDGDRNDWKPIDT